MGALQSGLLSPVAVPENYYAIVIDLKDCFFTITLQPEDMQRFAFSIPYAKFQRPLGNMNWIRPYLKITTGQLHHLFKILEGDPDPKSKTQLT